MDAEKKDKHRLIEFRCGFCGARFRNREAVPDDAGAVETACVVCHRPLRMPLPPRAEQLDFPEAA
jgi:hypothetical protein